MSDFQHNHCDTQSPPPLLPWPCGALCAVLGSAILLTLAGHVCHWLEVRSLFSRRLSRFTRRTFTGLLVLFTVCAVAACFLLMRAHQMQPWGKSVNYTLPWFTRVETPRKPTRFLLTPPPLPASRCCPTAVDANRTLVTFIKSSVANRARRDLMRRTWTSVCHANGWRFHAVFVVGRPHNLTTRRQLAAEHRYHGDLLQYDDADGYYNMPTKVLAGMQWAAENLRPGHFYASADDDFFVDVAAFTERYERLAARGLTAGEPIMCLFRRGDWELVDRVDKWKISVQDYPSSIYPRYCHGGMYVMSVAVASRLLAEARRSPVLPFDDVWLTGIVRHRAGIDEQRVIDMEPVAVHYGGKRGRTEEQMQDAVDADWTCSYAKMLANEKNFICKYR